MTHDQSDFAYANPTKFSEIPVIDLSDFHTEKGFERCAKEIVDTARSVGFFYLINHGVPSELRSTAFDASKRFFELSEDRKSTVSVNEYQRGWMRQGLSQLEGSKTHDAKEVFFWGHEIEQDDPDYLAGVPLVAPNQWPQETAPWIRKSIAPYYEAVQSVAQTVLSAIAYGLGQDKQFFEPHYIKPLARGQLVYYPPSSDKDLADGRMGAAAHTDFGVLTMLAQDNSGGLQVRNASGDWIEAPPIDDSFVCNIGDLLEHWTNGALTSTLHRVINRTQNARYSIPVFCDPRSTAEIDPSQFDPRASAEPKTAGEHIVSRNKKNFAHYGKG